MKRINTAGEDLPPLSVTKDRGVMLQSEKYKKRIATDVRKYQVACRGEFVFDPMSLYYGAIGRQNAADRGLISPDYVAFEVDETVDPLFLDYLLRWPRQHAIYESNAETGNTFGKRRRLYWSVLETLAFDLPPLVEQQKITTILSSVDDVIEQTDAVIAQLQVVKRAMMEELLSRGLRGRHTRFKMTEIGEVPEGWEIASLEDLMDRIIDYRGKSPPKAEHGTPLITAKNVRAGFIDEEPREFIDAAAFDEWMVRGIPLPGDVLFTTEAPLGNAAPVPSTRIALGQRLITLCPSRNRMDPVFLLWAVLSPSIQKAIHERGTGSTVKGIKQSVLRQLPLPVPDIEEQVAVGEALQRISDRILAETQFEEGLRATRSALMSALLTGEVRVKADQEVAA